ncbi:MAG: glycosyltransferase family 2 protein [Candidatus Omnitrophica bacterium]|nr:glycosyltransferase family 2 protein [Candidatus Omnitrophota bacterium]
MEKAPVSICIIAKNEERRLPDCLASVRWADEVVVLDDDSVDKTIEVAKNFGAKVLSRKMDIEGRQRNFAYAGARNAWVLSLDADERVTPELAEQIKKAVQSPNGYAAFSIPIRTFIGSRWISGAGYYPAPKVRLFLKDKFRYEEAGVHPRMLLDGKCGSLQGDILHYSCRNFGEFLGKLNRETALEAEKWIEDGRKVSLAGILRKTVDRFLKNYFLKGGWKDGFQGFLMSYFHSLYQLMSYAKYWEMKQK